MICLLKFYFINLNKFSKLKWTFNFVDICNFTKKAVSQKISSCSLENISLARILSCLNRIPFFPRRINCHEMVGNQNESESSFCISHRLKGKRKN